jgi:threonine/homoserine/homoserine lactone efflux protein
MMVARHEMPGIEPSAAHQTVPYGTDQFCTFPGISCLATLIESLRDKVRRLPKSQIQPALITFETEAHTETKAHNKRMPGALRKICYFLSAICYSELPMTADLTIWTALMAFAGAAGLLTIVPGLDTLLVLRTATVEGPRRAMFAGLGICTGCLVWGILVSAGLGAVFAVSNLAYQIVRIAGAIYMFYLGIRLLSQREKPTLQDSTGETPFARGSLRWFIRGLLSNLLNPKVGVFYVTFLPQFIPSHVNVIGFSVLLALIHDVEGVLWFAALIFVTQPIARWLRNPRTTTVLNRITGSVFIFFGARLALERKS